MKITNYYIFKELLYQLYVNLIKKREKMVLIDAPLLYETKILQFICYPVIVVFLTDENLQIERLCSRDQITSEEAKKKIQSQMSLKDKMKKADVLVCNDSSVREMQEELLKKLSSLFIR